jgi:gamma-glutamylcyclotransferase (GGCT)/AIG2-like uncharacterized protein YtfP
MNNFYFAYGANLNRASMRRRCPNAVALKSLYLRDWQLAFSGVATVLPAKGHSVPGALWQITDECEASLDHFEGFPDLYRKHYLKQDGHSIMFYVMNTDSVSPPASSYLSTIREGYNDWWLPTTALEQAVQESYSRVADTTE